jgi:hypothetical protein
LWESPSKTWHVTLHSSRRHLLLSSAMVLPLAVHAVNCTRVLNKGQRLVCCLGYRGDARIVRACTRSSVVDAWVVERHVRM